MYSYSLWAIYFLLANVKVNNIFKHDVFNESSSISYNINVCIIFLVYRILLTIFNSKIYFFSSGFDENNQNIAVILTCLKIGKKLNLLKEKGDKQKWKGVIDFCLLEKCMYHFDEDVSIYFSFCLHYTNIMRKTVLNLCKLLLHLLREVYIFLVH